MSASLPCGAHSTGSRTIRRMPVDARHRVRSVANWVNLSTPAGLVLARVAAGPPRRARNGVWLAHDYRLPVPPAPAFTLGSVVFLRSSLPGSGRDPVGSVSRRLLDHEERHVTQYAWCGGVVMPVAYTLPPAGRGCGPATSPRATRSSGALAWPTAATGSSPSGRSWRRRGSRAVVGTAHRRDPRGAPWVRCGRATGSVSPRGDGPQGWAGCPSPGSRSQHRARRGDAGGRRASSCAGTRG